MRMLQPWEYASPSPQLYELPQTHADSPGFASTEPSPIHGWVLPRNAGSWLLSQLRAGTTCILRPGRDQRRLARGSCPAAVICFEWLQRPENVLAGYLRWPDDGTLFYSDAEAVLAALPRRGVPMILRPARNDSPAKPYNIFAMDRPVRTLRNKLRLPSTFTLDACRHGGMTELEEAELTTGQGRALSGHRTARAYEGLCQADDGARPGYPKAACAYAGIEHSGNIYSE